MLVDRVPWWLRNTFQSDPNLPAPVRYRFEVTGVAPVKPDVVVAAEGYAIEPISDTPGNVTFNCNSSECVLLIYGRLDLDQASATRDLRIEGNREQVAKSQHLVQGCLRSFCAGVRASDSHRTRENAR